jgi:hypothetical protein
MGTLRKIERPAWRERAALWAMAAGVFVLGATLVGVFVLVPVFLLTAPQARTVEAEADRIEDTAAAVKAPPPPPVSKPAPPAEPPREVPAIDEEGFIRHWLVLGPVPAAKEVSGLAEINKQQLRNEARVRPREGEKARAAGREFFWRAHRAPEYFIDFRKALEGRGEDAVAYAVCYVTAPSEVKGLRLTMGSNDQGRVYLNGAPLIQFDKSRVLAKDSEVANDVALRRGENLLVFKVVNEKNNWQGCVRFTDRAGQPVRNLRISLSPP